MYPQSPRNIILAGDLQDDEITSLANYCRRLRSNGEHHVHIDMAAVINCDRTGLDGLTALVGGSSGLVITIGGAHWAQFMVMLSHASVRDLRGLRCNVRGLLAPEP